MMACVRVQQQNSENCCVMCLVHQNGHCLAKLMQKQSKCFHSTFVSFDCEVLPLSTWPQQCGNRQFIHDCNESYQLKASLRTVSLIMVPVQARAALQFLFFPCNLKLVLSVCLCGYLKPSQKQQNLASLVYLYWWEKQQVAGVELRGTSIKRSRLIIWAHGYSKSLCMVTRIHT